MNFFNQPKCISANNQAEAQHKMCQLEHAQHSRAFFYKSVDDLCFFFNQCFIFTKLICSVIDDTLFNWVFLFLMCDWNFF